jgi:hypothetical protein
MPRPKTLDEKSRA